MALPLLAMVVPSLATIATSLISYDMTKSSMEEAREQDKYISGLEQKDNLVSQARTNKLNMKRSPILILVFILIYLPAAKAVEFSEKEKAVIYTNAVKVLENYQTIINQMGEFVVNDIEKAKSKHWKMPASILSQLLQQRTKGRIITNIEEPSGSGPDPTVSPRIPDMPKGNLISNDLWTAFIEAIKFDDSPDHLWIEYTLIS